MNDCNFDLENLSPEQIQEFLSFLINKATLDPQTISKIDELYKFSESPNCEIIYLFLRLGLKSRWEPAFNQTLQFLKSMGRLKYTRPLYRDLYNWEEKREETIEFYKANKYLLMSVLVIGVNKDLKLCYNDF